MASIEQDILAPESLNSKVEEPESLGSHLQSHILGDIVYFLTHEHSHCPHDE